MRYSTCLWLLQQDAAVLPFLPCLPFLSVLMSLTVLFFSTLFLGNPTQQHACDKCLPAELHVKGHPSFKSLLLAGTSCVRHLALHVINI